MVNILYGVCGGGMGHATRSSVVIRHLIEKGHNVHVVSSNRSYRFLVESFPATRIYGIELKYKDNKLKKLRTLGSSIRPRILWDSVQRIRQIIKKQKTDLIVSDYEPATAYCTRNMNWNGLVGREKIPLICIDNIHVVSNCRVFVPRKYLENYVLVKCVNEIVSPRINVNWYIIPTFFYPKIKQKNTVLVPSLIRNEIINAKKSKKNHIVVYQTSDNYTDIFDILRLFKKENFIVYGFNISKKDNNIQLKRFSEIEFIKDLASSKAVITNGGFSFMSEAIFLHKPVLSIPVKAQFEQTCNAIYLQKRGFGKFQEELTKDGLSEFLKNISEYRKRLNAYTQKDNSKAFDVIDKMIEKATSGNRR